MEKIINFFISLFLYLIEIISTNLNFHYRIKFGKVIGNILVSISPKRFKIAVKNLKLAFPEKSEKWHNDTARQSFQNIGITYLEALALKHFTPEQVMHYIKYENIDLLNELYSRGKGLLLISAHYGNWELLACSANIYTGIPILIVVNPQRYGSEFLDKSRTKFGNKIVSKYNSAREIVNTIKHGGAIAMLADQSATQDRDLFVDFFGMPASTYEAPANLALRFKIPIVMGYAERKPDGKYYVNLIELKHDDLEYNKSGVLELTKRHVKITEDAIRNRPELWAWPHRRWKHTPPANT